MFDTLSNKVFVTIEHMDVMQLVQRSMANTNKHNLASKLVHKQDDTVAEHMLERMQLNHSDREFVF